MSKILDQDAQYIFENLENELLQLKDCTVLISGATGFFGKNILHFLLFLNESKQQNIKLLLLTRNKKNFLQRYPEFNHKACTYLEGSINNFQIPTENIDYVIHAAGETANLAQTNEIEILDTAYNGTKTVLEMAKNKNVKSVLYISSGAIYGEQPNDLTRIPETYQGASDLSQLKTCYSEGKRVAEYLCQFYGQKFDVPVKIARCFAFVGPHMPLDSSFACGNFINNALQKQSIVIRSDGKSTRSYLYTADLVIWLIKCLIIGKKLTPYNIGADQEISILQLAREVIKNFEHTVNIEFDAKTESKNNRYIPNNNKALNDLEIKSYFSFEKSIQRTVEYYKNEQQK